MLIEHDPHQLVEGITIASYAVQCNLAYVYLRGEFALGYERLTGAIDDARARGFLGENILGSGFDCDIVVHRGAGAYICGEETALLESLEGERGMPRIRPPFPAIAGLYAKPTVVNNVETLSTVPHIMRMGGEQYAKLGVNRSTGTRIFSVSGHVNKPGNYEVEFGMTFRDLHLRPRGRYARRPRDQVLHPRRRVVAVAHRSRRAPRRSARHGLRAADLRRDARFRRGDGVRRDGRSGAGRVAARQVLRARVVREVHSVPRRNGVDREDPLPHVTRAGTPRGSRPPRLASAATSRPAWRTRRSCRRRSARSARRSSADRQPRQVLPRRDRRTSARRGRSANA